MPEISLIGNSIEITDGGTTPDVSDDTDFGLTPVVGGAVDRTFIIENTGRIDLNHTGTP